MIEIEVGESLTHIDGADKWLRDKLIKELSVKDHSHTYVIKRHLKEVHPWKCENKDCGYTEPREISDRQYTKVCPICSDLMAGYKSWCEVCNKQDVVQYDSLVEVYGAELYGEDRLIIPSGLLKRALHIIKSANTEYDLWFTFDYPEPNTIPSSKELRDYQKGVYNAAIRTIRGMWESPTGSGKTIIGLKVWSYWGLPGVVIVPTQDIQLQFYEECEDMFSQEVFDKIGLIGGHAKKILKDAFSPGELLTIATFQTLSSESRRDQVFDFFTGIDFILVDEHHHSACDSIYETVESSSARIKYGQSATLYHNKSGIIRLEAITGPVITKISDKKITEDGWKATPIVRMTAVDGVMCDEFDEAKQLNIYENPQVLEVVHKACLAHDGLILALTDRKAHMRAIYLYLKNRGVDVDIVCSDTSSDNRTRILEDMRNGNIDCVVATQVFDEGIDVPDALGVVLAAGGLSPIKHKQRIGRVLRPKKGENVAYIYDMYIRDSSHNQRHATIRLSRYKKWEWDIEDSGIEVDEHRTMEYIFTEKERRFIETGK